MRDLPNNTPLRPVHPAAGQTSLFDNTDGIDETLGYRSKVVEKLVGITYRQLDNWTRTGLIKPHIRPAKGSGTQRLYSFRDILELKIIKNLLDTGVSLQQIRIAIDHLHSKGYEDISQLTLMSDGATIFECSNPDDIADVLHGSQGVFGINLGAALQEVSGSILEIPAEKTVVEDENNIIDFRQRHLA
ncbi:MAG: MerR family transcriptional regulator [Micrococcaceae bacterium]